MNDPALITFFRKVQITAHCWFWKSYGHPDGYGVFRFNGEKWYAHRFVYLRLVGPIPKDKELDHLCREPSCVNPQHLEAVTHKENMLRGISGIRAAKKYCIHGHKFTKANTYIRTNGCRDCRLCGIERTREYMKRKKK